MAAIKQTIHLDAFLSMKSFVGFFKILFLRVRFTITPHWFRYWHGAEYATRHYMNQYWPSSMMYICGTRMRWFNTWKTLAVKLRQHTVTGLYPAGIEMYLEGIPYWLTIIIVCSALSTALQFHTTIFGQSIVSFCVKSAIWCKLYMHYIPYMFWISTQFKKNHF